MSKMIDADALMQSLGITNMDCGKCAWYDAEWSHCKRGGDFEDACCAIENAPTIEDLSGFCDKLWRGAYERGKEDGKAERKTGKWVKYAECDCLKCDQCGMPSMNVQNFCCRCGAKMEPYEGGEG